MAPDRPEGSPAARQAVVVGAGPVGCVAAQILIRNGYAVTVYEKRPHFIERGIGGEGRTINLSLAPRGMKVLEAHCDRDELRAMAVAMDGRVTHPEHGPPQQAKYGRPEWLTYSLGRNELNVMLMRDAERGAGARFEFGHRCSSVDVHGKKAFFETEDGRRVQASYDLLVGADGSLSQVREQLAAEGALTFHRKELEASYREFALWPAGDQKDPTPSAIHLWPRDSFFMVALPNRDGSLRCTLVLPEDDRYNFSRLNNDQAIKGFFRQHFPDAAESLRLNGASASRNLVSTISVTSCSRLTHAGSVLLVGDAAHSVAPFLGQGVNLGLEDCVVLERLLQKHPDDQASALAEYDRERKIDGDAASCLSLANYAELSATTSFPRPAVDSVAHDPWNAPRSRQQEFPLPVLVNFLDLAYRDVLEKYQGQTPSLLGDE